eukprot:g25499.t1
MADIWEEVGRWVKAEDLRLAMEREAQSIESLKARMNLDVEGTKNKIKELQMQCENVSKAFTKDQESRLFEIVNVAARLQELKKLISNAVHSDDVRVWQEQYDPLQKASLGVGQINWPSGQVRQELTKDLNDSQLQQAFQFVTLKQDIETNEEQISKEHIEGELKKWTEVPQYRYNALQRQLAKLKQERRGHTSILADVDGEMALKREVWTVVSSFCTRRAEPERNGTKDRFTNL